MRQAFALLIVVSTAAVLAAGAVGPLAEETGALAPVPAQRAPLNRGDDCLSPADLREAVAEKARRTAHRRDPRGAPDRSAGRDPARQPVPARSGARLSTDGLAS
ncbi:conserved exported protein of unknown function [Methylorubrum extorquens]|uniref:Uncharacterized protein n=1 Tax=Methylorubrum extorquens TaxID=408 RepID=A0A2N9AV28_METEX|nr:conserved exported protein of unknown function [Methylorubrum extorquens]